MTYKIVTGLVGIPLNQYLVPVNVINKRQHPLAYHIPDSRCSYHLCSFFPSAVRLWNSLPRHSVTLNSLDAFKSNIQTPFFLDFIYIYNVAVYKLLFLCSRVRLPASACWGNIWKKKSKETHSQCRKSTSHPGRSTFNACRTSWRVRSATFQRVFFEGVYSVGTSVVRIERGYAWRRMTPDLRSDFKKQT